MHFVQRARDGLRTVIGDPIGRRAYVGRLKWLIRGSGDLHAHSLEYRAGLSGRWTIPTQRTNPDEELVVRCPADCSAHAPLSHLYERRFVYELHHTIASTASGATLMYGSQQPLFFVRESIPWPYESILSHGLEVPEAKQAVRHAPGKSIIFPTTPNYYHWLIEDVPAVIRAARAAPEASLVSFAEGVTERHKLVSDALGMDLHSAPLVVKMETQVMAGRASDSWFVHPSDAAILADFGRQLTHQDDDLTSTGLEDPNTRIYISRRNTTRPLPHEDRVERLLQQHGFSILELENMSWPDQIRAFQHAETIVAPHGAGLANLVFTPPGATVIEVTFGLHYNRCFEWLCHVKNHQYTKVDGDSGAHTRIEDIIESVIAG